MTENRIQKLSPLLINQIAAGEVVTRPASVVKELLENAIDAGATHITVHIEQGGIGLIQVADNGRGIHPDDMILAVTRHATSKLADVGELTGIHSLGFRGEALASIAAVSHLTLTSSSDDTGIGQQLSLSGSDTSHIRPNDIRPVVKSQGTTVTVRDLYFNVPARRANLKSIATEFAQIEQVVQRIAISFADVGLQLFHQNKLRLNLKSAAIAETNANNSLSKEKFANRLTASNLTLNRLENALNLPLQNFAIPFEVSLTGLQLREMGEQKTPANIYGWLFISDTITHNMPIIPQFPKLIYINQRLVTDFAISQTIAKSARQAGINGLPAEGRMGYALFFDLPVEWINVNIHPSKQQVKIQPLTNILALLNQALQEKLTQHLAKISAISPPTYLQNQVGLNLQPPDINEKVITKNGVIQPALPNMSKDVSQNLHKQNAILTKNLPRNSLQHQAQVKENSTDYAIENATFSAFDLFDNSPKFLKIVEKDSQPMGLIFWQENLYLLPVAVITPECLSDKNRWELALQHAIVTLTQVELMTVLQKKL